MINLYTAEEIGKIRIACRIVYRVLRKIETLIEPDARTIDINDEIGRLIRGEGAAPAFLGYRGYPRESCISVNEAVVHGIPGNRRLKAGDIVSVDIGVLKDGFYGDAACTFAVGKINPDAEKLLRVTEESLYLGIERAQQNNRVSDISHAIQKHIESNGFSVVRAFVGHGIGRDLHEDPQIPNFGLPGRGPRLRSGITMAIEPMVNAGRHEVVVLDDGWTAVTMDGTLSAHFEHTILVTEDQPKILTKIH